MTPWITLITLLSLIWAGALGVLVYEAIRFAHWGRKAARRYLLMTQVTADAITAHDREHIMAARNAFSQPVR
jgi:hypothetical protein